MNTKTKINLIITVDTEEDNSWKNDAGNVFTTKNGERLSRFQSICDKHGFQPVYFVTYPMITDESVRSFLVSLENQGRCEIGMHMHAWSTPPYVSLENKFGGMPYIYDYSEKTIREKVQALTDAIVSATGHHPVSHRSGRWALNDTYLNILAEEGYRYDFSMVPYMDFRKFAGAASYGPDYRKIRNRTYCLPSGIIEYPVGVALLRSKNGVGALRKIRNLLFGKKTWLRPALSTLDEMVRVTKKTAKQAEYVEFMIHSSELLEEASPYNKTVADTERFLEKIDQYFSFLSANYDVVCKLPNQK